MERIAIISDLHGSLVATQSVIEDIKKKGIKRIFCLGDLVAKGSQPKETVEYVRKECEVVVKGNCDDLIINHIETEEHLWNKNKIGKENEEYLNNLPLYYDFYMSGLKIRLLHATSNSLYKSIEYYKVTNEMVKDIDNLFNNSKEFNNENTSKPDIVIFGHIHSPFIYRLDNKMAINPGSTSNGLDIYNKNGKTIHMSSYLILEGEYNSKEMSSISFKIVKIPYDYNEEINRLKNTDMPNKDMAIKELETGIYVKR